MKKTIILVCLILLFYYLCSIYINKNNLKIPNESIRIRVLANSNSVEDQNIKKIVSMDIMRYLNNELKNVKNIEEARKKIISLQSDIDFKVSEILDKNNVNQELKSNFGYNYFPKKKFKNDIYEEGYYESLLITLGEGKGNNWWCILFPPVCLLEAEESEEVEYNFFIFDFINKIFH